MIVYIKTGSDAWQFRHRQGCVRIWALPRRRTLTGPIARSLRTPSPRGHRHPHAAWLSLDSGILNVITETSGSAVSQLVPCRSACTQIGVH
jgi:hypothetical protein